MDWDSMEAAILRRNIPQMHHMAALQAFEEARMRTQGMYYDTMLMPSALASMPANKPKTMRACVRCRSMKQSCSDERPCKRCDRLGLGDQCCDSAPSTSTRKRKAHAPSQSSKSAHTGCEGGHPSTSDDLTEPVTTTIADSPPILDSPFPDHVKESDVKPESITDAGTSVFQKLYQHLRTMKEQFQLGLTPVAKGVFSWWARGFPRRTTAYLKPEERESYYSDLSTIITEPAIDLDRQSVIDHISGLQKACEGAPVAIISSNIHTLSINDVYVNDEASRLLGYSKDYISRRLATDGTFWMEVWQPADLSRMFSIFFNCVARRQERFSCRAWINHASGPRFEALLQTQISYTSDGAPLMHTVYFSRIGDEIEE